MNKAQIDFLNKLKRKKYRDKYGKFLVENPKVILEEYNSPLLDSIYATEKFFKEYEDLMAFDKVEIISEKALDRVSSQVTPAGIIALFNLPKEKNFSFKTKHILLLDGIQDPGNLGTIIRTADWFGWRAIFLGKNCVEPFNPKVVAASMGSIFRSHVYQDTDLVALIKDLKKERYTIATTDLHGGNIDTKEKENIALVIGNESKGVSLEIKDIADKSFKIPKFGKAESLNAAVAAGIIMHKIKS